MGVRVRPVRRESTFNIMSVGVGGLVGLVLWVLGWVAGCGVHFLWVAGFGVGWGFVGWRICDGMAASRLHPKQMRSPVCGARLWDKDGIETGEDRVTLDLTR